MEDIEKLIKTTLGRGTKGPQFQDRCRRADNYRRHNHNPVLSVGFGIGAGGALGKSDDKQAGRLQAREVAAPAVLEPNHRCYHNRQKRG